MRSRGNADTGRRLINWAFILVIGVLVVLSLPWFRPYLPICSLARNYVAGEPRRGNGVSLPRRAGAQDLPRARIWELSDLGVPRSTGLHRHEGRALPARAVEDYLNLSAGRYDWEAILARYRIDTLLLDKQAQKPLIDAARASPAGG